MRRRRHLPRRPRRYRPAPTPAPLEMRWSSSTYLISMLPVGMVGAIAFASEALAAPDRRAMGTGSGSGGDGPPGGGDVPPTTVIHAAATAARGGGPDQAAPAGTARIREVPDQSSPARNARPGPRAFANGGGQGRRFGFGRCHGRRRGPRGLAPAGPLGGRGRERAREPPELAYRAADRGGSGPVEHHPARRRPGRQRVGPGRGRAGRVDGRRRGRRGGLDYARRGRGPGPRPSGPIPVPGSPCRPAGPHRPPRPPRARANSSAGAVTPGA